MNNNEEKRSTGAHNLILEERGSLTVTGVSTSTVLMKKRWWYIQIWES